MYKAESLPKNQLITQKQLFLNTFDFANHYQINKNIL